MEFGHHCLTAAMEFRHFSPVLNKIGQLFGWLVQGMFSISFFANTSCLILMLDNFSIFYTVNILGISEKNKFYCRIF